MDHLCNFCGFVRKDYHNVYGTTCYNCGKHILPETEPEFLEEKNKEKKILQNEVIETLRRIENDN